jgi:predicted phage-related endonuclease
MIAEVKWASRGMAVVPDHYYLQVLWQMALSGVHAASLVVGEPHEINAHPIEWDEGLAGDMLESVDRFWTDNVQARVPPEPSTDEELRDHWLDRLAKATATVQADDAMEAVGRSLAALKRQESEAKAGIAGLSQELTRMMDGAAAKRVAFSSGAKALVIDKAGSISYKAVAEKLGATPEILEAHRGDRVRYVLFTPAKGEGG